MGSSSSKMDVSGAKEEVGNSQGQQSPQILNTSCDDDDIENILGNLETSELEEAIALSAALHASQMQLQQNQQSLNQDDGVINQSRNVAQAHEISIAEAAEILDQNGEQIEWELNQKAALQSSDIQQLVEEQEIQEAISLVEAVQVGEQNGEKIDWDLNQEYWKGQKECCSEKQEVENNDELKTALERIQVLEATLAAMQPQNGDNDFFEVPFDLQEFDESGWQCQVCTKWNEDMDSQECSECHMGRVETNCPICLDSIDIEQLFLASMCNHHFHRDCAKKSVLSDMNSNTVPVQCPVCKTSKCEQCGFVVGTGPEEEGGNCCIFNQRDIKDLLDPTDYERYLNIELRETCKTYQYFQCPGANCGQYYDVEEKQEKVVCPYCEFRVCLECGVPWHEGSTCEKYQKWVKENRQGDEKFEEMRRRLGMKECPKCHLNVIKDSPQQCNKMTCNNCRPRIYFCWICGQEIKGYEHFNDKNSPCNGKLWQGVNIEQA